MKFQERRGRESLANMLKVRMEDTGGEDLRSTRVVPVAPWLSAVRVQLGPPAPQDVVEAHLGVGVVVVELKLGVHLFLDKRKRWRWR